MWWLANVVPRVPPSLWLETAREVLVCEGIEAVKVDRLAQRLGVTRGGFYHHFHDRDDLLAQLLAHWERAVVFVLERPVPKGPAAALQALDALTDRLIYELGYDSRFDLAVRAWAHADSRAADAVARSDKRRIAALNRIFLALGCDRDEAALRARVFYFHQIGYYAIGVSESARARHARAMLYMRILCGDENLAAARRASS